MHTSSEAIAILCRGCEKVLNENELRAKLELGRPLRIKLGVDPTAPDIHLGHGVVLGKLREFQDLGHEAILIIGDFTAMIGDPSGRSATRPQLTHEQVLSNARSYQDQAFKILSRERAKIVFNGEWFEAMSFEEVIKLNSRVTLQQMLVREDFRDRLDRGQAIRAHEIQYPIMQGWDSVMIKSDVELGGTDQLFNIMVGRDLQREEGLPQQVAMVMPILEGLDGKQKMSKSLGNYVALNESPSEMFGKIMSISDELMPRYYEILLHEKQPEGMHPMEAKKALAQRIAARFHCEQDGLRAREEFETRFSKKDLASSDLPEYAPGESRDIVSIVVDAFAKCFSITKSRSDARRLVEGGSVQWRGEKVTDPKAVLPSDGPGDLKLDKTHAVRLP
jgi:tyrosyl-tRNA synthetase